MRAAGWLPLALASIATAQFGPLPADADPALASDMTNVTPSFRVKWEIGMELDEPVSGRLVLYFINDNGSGIGKGMKPANGPFWDNLQPMYAVNVEDFGPGDTVDVTTDAMGYPVPLNELEEGVYRVQAVLHCQQEGSDWIVEDGNYYSGAWYVYMPGEDGVISKDVLQQIGHEVTFPQELPLERRTKPRNYAPLESVSWVDVPSKLLSEATGREVVLKAGVLAPTIRRTNREYPAVYELPAYGENYTNAWRMGRLRTQMPGFNTKLNRSAYRISVGVDGMWGHTLLANSDVNGPVMDAIITELIPAIEEKYPLIAEPEARVLWGSSSGGWAAIWLMLNRPDFFGAAWGACPDPVDFRAFQQSNLYEDENLYTDAAGEDRPAYWKDGKQVMSVRTENLIEELLGPKGTSGQQWDSWNAVFGTMGSDGSPVPLFDWKSGKIDKDTFNKWTRFDISKLVAEAPDKYGPIFRDNIRVLVGEDDNYDLDEAVKLLRDRLRDAGYLSTEEDDHFGSIRILEEEDHFTLQDWKWQAEIGSEVYQYILDAGVKDRPIESEDDGS